MYYIRNYGTGNPKFYGTIANVCEYIGAQGPVFYYIPVRKFGRSNFTNLLQGLALYSTAFADSYAAK